MQIYSQKTQITAATLVEATVIFSAAELVILRGLIPRLPAGDPAISILQGLPTDGTATATAGTTTTLASAL